jgi:hypothetical protein
MAVVDPRVTEFQCIMPIGNIPSVMQHGILSYERAAALDHDSVAMPEIQDKRDRKQVPGGLKLHQYANLYFHARNPMMYKRKDEADQLCVLRISVDVCAEDGVVFADRNASSDYVRFLHPSQWKLLSFDDIYAISWTHPNDPPAYYRHRSIKCAEVLVPHRVNVARLLGAHVVDEGAAARMGAAGFQLPVTTTPELFFR